MRVAFVPRSAEIQPPFWRFVTFIHPHSPHFHLTLWNYTLPSSPTHTHTHSPQCPKLTTNTIIATAPMRSSSWWEQRCSVSKNPSSNWHTGDFLHVTLDSEHFGPWIDDEVEAQPILAPFKIKWVRVQTRAEPRCECPCWVLTLRLQCNCRGVLGEAFAVG